MLDQVKNLIRKCKYQCRTKIKMLICLLPKQRRIVFSARFERRTRTRPIYKR